MRWGESWWSFTLHVAIELVSFRHARPVEAKGSNTMRKEYDFRKGKRGPAIPSPGKTRITIMLDDDVIEHFREAAEGLGTGYQTMINSVLRAAVADAKGKKSEDKPLTASTLRKILREELQAP